MQVKFRNVMKNAFLEASLPRSEGGGDGGEVGAGCGIHLGPKGDEESVADFGGLEFGSERVEASIHCDRVD